ncbi:MULTISPECIES: ABC transporter permease [Metallibacterium]|jgi:sodium transport system permease protein|uniref:ABC transporter permease n=1 Tax=Metallibacterium TaxID=1218803 RepID=UPI0026147AF4|nr:MULTISPECIES: ABC transporter permease [Metallibacterium]MBW8075164.1 ABC transporter permease subunit [Metallibacterium scheffleri]
MSARGFRHGLRAALTVYLKEVRENLRDKRTVLNALITGPLLGPILFGMIFSFTLQRQLAEAEKPLPVPVVGAQYAPNLLHALEAQGLVVKPAPKDAAAAVRTHAAKVVLVIPPGFDAAWRKGQPAGVELYYDSARQDSGTPVHRLKKMLQTYAATLAAQRLLVRGISPVLMRPVVAEDRDLATPQSRSALMFSILPYFFVLTVFLGGMYLAIDTTAGERERQSLEPLLANPVGRGTLLAGKLAATVSFALVSLLLATIAFGVVGRFLPVEKLDIVLDLGPRFAAFVLLLMLPLAVLLATLQTLVSAYAKSYREAQTYLSILMLLPVIPSLLLAVLPVQAKPWMYAVPLLGQQLGIMDLVRGEAIGALPLAAVLAGTSLAAVLAFALTRWLYASERLAVSG